MTARGYACRIAIADTPGAANAAARFGPDHDAVLSSGAQRATLAPLPVSCLRLESSVATGLRRLGFHTVADLQAAPRAPLVRRFGAGPTLRLDQALGAIPEPIRPVQPRDAISAKRSLMEPIMTAEAIGAVIEALVPDVCAELTARSAGARLLDLICEIVDGAAQAVRVGTATAIRDPAHLARLLKERIETIDPGFGIEAMRLVVIRAEAIDPSRHAGVLIGVSQNNPAGADLSCLIDRLRNRVGPDRVYRLERRQSHIPERAQAFVRYDGHAKDEDWSEGVSDSSRPVRLFDPPQPIAVTMHDVDGAPASFTWRRSLRRIHAADGPERTHAEWWSSACEFGAARDYWIVEDEAGERFWIFRRCDESGATAWFLHGLF